MPGGERVKLRWMVADSYDNYCAIVMKINVYVFQASIMMSL